MLPRPASAMLRGDDAEILARRAKQLRLELEETLANCNDRYVARRERERDKEIFSSIILMTINILNCIYAQPGQDSPKGGPVPMAQISDGEFVLFWSTVLH